MMKIAEPIETIKDFTIILILISTYDNSCCYKDVLAIQKSKDFVTESKNIDFNCRIVLRIFILKAIKIVLIINILLITIILAMGKI